MRVLYPFRIDAYGPISTIFREVGKRIEPDAVGFIGSNPPRDLDFQGIEYIKLNKSKITKRFSYVKYQIFKNFDVIHTSPAIHNICSLLRQYVRETPVVHTIHNAERGTENRGYTDEVYRLLTVNTVKTLTAVSPYVAEKSRYYSLRGQDFGDDINIVPNGVDTDLFHPDRADTIPDQFLYIGRTKSRKNATFILKLCQEMPHKRFRIRISDGGSEIHKKFKKQDNAVILPKLSNLGLAEEYAAANAVLCPYEQEGFGMVIIEALSSGTPVVGLNDGNIPALLQHNAGVIVDDLDIAQWTQTLQSIQPDSLDEQARKSGQRYSWDKIASRYEAIYINSLR